MKLTTEQTDAILKKFNDYGIELIDRDSDLFNIKTISEEYFAEKVQEALDEAEEKEKKKGNYDLDCDFGTCVDEFKQYVGRKPRNKEEMETWTHLVRKGVQSQLDWDIINRCSAEHFKRGK